jgi:nucleoside-diphosphate-sugar epimerase
MKTILVTGISGKVGSAVARELLKFDYTVIGLDQTNVPEDLRKKVTMHFVDLTDRLSVLKAVDGVDAIAHLGAIPHPMGDENLIFPVNVTGTQWLFDAAQQHGVSRVAIASTGCTFGMIFAKKPFDPPCLPMDETAPTQPQDMYALSKVLCEEIAAAYTRRCGMTTVALRLTTVMNFTSNHWWKQRLEADRKETDLWTYIEMGDTARAFRLALENAADGTNTTALIAARDSFTKHDIRALVAKHYPQFAEAVAELKPTDSLYNTQRAEAAFGFVADRPWSEIPELN